MFAISPTDIKWFDFLKENQLCSFINFWTPTPWNIKGLNAGDKLYFMLKKPIRKIGGFGEFVEYKNVTPEEAWNEFGYRNGRESKTDFLQSLKKFISKHSIRFDTNNIDGASHKIGCIVLKNCEFWDEENYLEPSDFNISFPNQVVTIKYYNENNIIQDSHNIEKSNFNIVSEPREENKYEVNRRIGQNNFKAKLLKAYNNKCCISGETIPELLEAAHIQNYKNVLSNHVQNGLLLRVDIHRLFDNNLIYIDNDYVIHVSSLIEGTYYRQYDGKKLNLPKASNQYPLLDALELRKSEFRS